MNQRLNGLIAKVIMVNGNTAIIHDVNSDGLHFINVLFVA